jgi:hypothetical protein
MRVRAIAVVVILLSYGALGARQPAVRTAAALPVSAEEVARSLGFGSIDRSHFVLDVIRATFALGVPAWDARQQQRLGLLRQKSTGKPGETVPLPLDPSVWRETILRRQVQNDELIGAILSDRNAALLYHGLAALDDETLAWLGPDRDTLQHLLRHAGSFAAFGRSIRVRAGRVAVPGGKDMEPLWQSLLGADPARPGPFVRRLFGDDGGRAAWFYDSLAHLGENQLRFALGATLPAGSRAERARALLRVFEDACGEWRPEVQPFSRRALDPFLVLGLLDVTAEGALTGPDLRRIWERVFHDDQEIGLTVPVAPTVAAVSDPTPVDAAWLADRILNASLDLGRRRLETLLFAQRVFRNFRSDDPLVVPVLRAHNAFPALVQTLEHAGATAQTIGAAAARAQALNLIGNDRRRRVGILQFQGALGILQRIARAGSLPAAASEDLIVGLTAVHTSDRGYEGRLAGWIRKDLLPKLTIDTNGNGDAVEETILAAMAGVTPEPPSKPRVEWEGRTYRVSAAEAEFMRLKRTRERQGGESLGAAVTGVEKNASDESEQALAMALSSVLYAAYLGDPTGASLAGGDVALRHDLGMPSRPTAAAWRIPVEVHSGKGWRINGSLLGLETALARLSLRRLDAMMMPQEPKLVSGERQTASLTVALLNPRSMTDAARDEIAGALGRGRARLTALTGDRAEIDRVARDAGLSEWRREALAWTVAHDRERLTSRLSLVELMWLGRPREGARSALNAWGAAMLPLTGCLCLSMPRAAPWEELAGRPSLGLLATRGADVAILVADTLADLKLPAELAPGVIAYAMQDVINEAQPAHFDDWPEVSRAVAALTRDRLSDYIAALAAGGPLVPWPQTQDRRP